MQDDNPLWYDYAEAETAPSRPLLLLASVLSLSVGVMLRAARAYKASHRLWSRAAARMSRRPKIDVQHL
ncbi:MULTISPECIES: hypothetical protein [Methylobacterium]|jgi:hypothetical protein|nr:MULTISPECIES: hypothetical protein [Methylobacterium]TXN46750.1 hypothetical protein FV233_06870 [Methylobacterium sp. WL7]TXN72255.1 hypothetical protein FV228_09930 [Methylobacterium sp. WL18]GJE21899.1 hypothetical protein JHFBIEKO_2348 [Methylobacterium mesophilicum]